MPVLQGASRILERDRPLLMVEIQADRESIADLADSHGYEVLGEELASYNWDEHFLGNSFWFHREAHAALLAELRASAAPSEQLVGYGPAHDQGAPRSRRDERSASRRADPVVPTRTCMAAAVDRRSPASGRRRLPGGDRRAELPHGTGPTRLPGVEAQRGGACRGPGPAHPAVPHHGRGVLKRFVNYASWSLSSTLLGRRDLASADVVLVYSSPATAAAAAMLTQRLHAVPYVLLVQDLGPTRSPSQGCCRLAGRESPIGPQRLRRGDVPPAAAISSSPPA